MLSGCEQLSCVQGCWVGAEGNGWRAVGRGEQAVDTEENLAGKGIFPQLVPYYDISAVSFFGVWPCGLKVMSLTILQQSLQRLSNSFVRDSELPREYAECSGE